jgi:hypothetical protein
MNARMNMREESQGWTEAELAAHAACGARWWADLLRSDLRASLIGQAGYAKGGEESARAGFFGDVMMAMIRKDDPPMTPEQIDCFEVLLAQRIRAQFAERGAFPPYASLVVDYVPDRDLFECAEAVGIPRGGEHIFPLKTRMHIGVDVIDVGLGYGARCEPLWETKRYAVSRLLGARFEAISPYREGREPPEGEAEAWNLEADRARRAQDRLSDYSGPIEELVERCFAQRHVAPRYRLRLLVPGPMPAEDIAKITAVEGVEIEDETARTMTVRGGDHGYGGELLKRIVDCQLGRRWAIEEIQRS